MGGKHLSTFSTKRTIRAKVGDAAGSFAVTREEPVIGSWSLGVCCPANRFAADMVSNCCCLQSALLELALSQKDNPFGFSFGHTLDQFGDFPAQTRLPVQSGHTMSSAYEHS